MSAYEHCERGLAGNSQRSNENWSKSRRCWPHAHRQNGEQIGQQYKCLNHYKVDWVCLLFLWNGRDWWTSCSFCGVHACPATFKLFNPVVHTSFWVRCFHIVLRNVGEFQPQTHLLTIKFGSLRWSSLMHSASGAAIFTDWNTGNNRSNKYINWWRLRDTNSCVQLKLRQT